MFDLAVQFPGNYIKETLAKKYENTYVYGYLLAQQKTESNPNASQFGPI